LYSSVGAAWGGPDEPGNDAVRAAWKASSVTIYRGGDQPVERGHIHGVIGFI
jgi:hypothetical protein